MANRERGELGVDVGGKRYTLRPKFNAICELEDVAGAPVHEILQRVQDGRVSGVRAIIFALLNDSHGEEILTLRDAGNWIERAGGVDKAREYIDQVFELNADDEPKGAPGNPPQAQGDGTGEPSKSALVESV